jgi:multiple sugar transport system substrate-binding protein
VLAADDEQFRQLAKNGLYADLTPLIAADREVQPARFYRSLWDSFRVGEKQYALPYIGNCLLVFYNRDHRRAAGLTPDPDPNWDWDGFNRDAVALTRDLDGDGRTDQFGLNRLTWFYCLQWVWDAGGTDMDPSMTRYVFDTPEAKRGFQFHYDHMHKWKVCPMTGDLPNMNAESMFLTGKVSMVIAGSWWLVQAARAKNFEWDVAAMPRGPVARTTRVTGEGIAISPQCKHRREAWEWVKFVAGQEGQAIFAKYGRGIPSFRDMARSRYPNPRTPQHEERFLDAMEYARISSLHEHFIATEAVFNREWDRLTLGQLTVEEWIKKTLPEVNAIIRGEDL